MSVLVGSHSAFGQPAQPQRTFVASYGLDTNPCSLPAPCRGFQAAINAVAAGGEVVALDSAGYGAMEIHKSLSVIVPPGVHAGLSPATGIPLPGYPGHYGVVLIDIQDTDVVVLRGLNINHQGTVTGGIEWISANGGAVHIENVVVNGFPEALYVEAPTAKVFIKDFILRGNGVGIYGGIAGGASTAQTGGIFADRVRIEDSYLAAVRVLTNVGARISNCVIASNQVAFHIRAITGHSNVFLDHCTVVENHFIYTLESADFWNAYLGVAASSFFHNYANGTRIGGNTNTVSFGNNSGDNGLTFFDGSSPPY
jgi:hypothetical protein